MGGLPALCISSWLGMGDCHPPVVAGYAGKHRMACSNMLLLVVFSAAASDTATRFNCQHCAAVCVCRPPAMGVTCGCPVGCPTRLPAPSSRRGQHLQARLYGAAAATLAPAPACRCLPACPPPLLKAALAAAAGRVAVPAAALAAVAATEVGAYTLMSVST